MDQTLLLASMGKPSPCSRSEGPPPEPRAPGKEGERRQGTFGVGVNRCYRRQHVAASRGQGCHSRHGDWLPHGIPDTSTGMYPLNPRTTPQTPDFPSNPGASHTERGRGERERDVDCRSMEEPRQVVEEYNGGGAQSREGGCDPPLPLSRSPPPLLER